MSIIIFVQHVSEIWLCAVDQEVRFGDKKTVFKSRVYQLILNYISAKNVDLEEINNF